MIRTHILPCRLPHGEAESLNRESGRIYTEVLVWHYRIYRRTRRWLSPQADERLNDSFGPSTLHAHSRDAAQQGFAKACKTAKANRGRGAKYPHRRKRYRTTVWKATGITREGDRLRLARARGVEPIFVALPPELAVLPPPSFVEMRLVYDPISRRHQWHLVVDDGRAMPEPPGQATLAADLGEIHPAAVADEQGAVVIFTARELRAINQYRHKQLASLQAVMARKQKGSRRWKRLARRKTFLRTRNKRQRRDIEHKVTRAIANHAQEAGAKRLVVGDVRNIGTGKRLNTNAQQKVSGWSHGKQVDYLTSKLAAFGIALERQSEAYSSKTCPCCGAHNKPNGRHYRCASCGFVGHRDAVGAINQVSKAVHGSYGHVPPTSVMYRRPFRRRSSRDTGHVARGQPREAVALSGVRSVTVYSRNGYHANLESFFQHVD